jgi:membrane protein implicated in regulation of membrane protease activity
VLGPELLSSPYFWAGLFVLMMIIEISTTGAFAGFLGIGALITAFFVHFVDAASNEAILFIFLAATCGNAAILWKPLKHRYARDTTDAEEGIEPFTNDFGTVEGEPLTTTGGKIILHGAGMRAVLSSDAGVDQVEVGTRVQVVRQDADQRFVVIPAP